MRLTTEQIDVLTLAAVTGGMHHHLAVTPRQWPAIKADLERTGVRFIAIRVAGPNLEPAEVQVFAASSPGRSFAVAVLTPAATAARMRVWLFARDLADVETSTAGRREQAATAPGAGRAERR